MTSTPSSNPSKAHALRSHKEGRPLSVLTAYDYPTARLLDEAGVDAILVGDSLGMMVLGHADTTQVTLDDMVHHTRATRRGVQQACLISDLPIATYRTPEEALTSARRLVEAGADAVKLEGGRGQLPQIDAMIAGGIAVIGHLGMLPQRVREEGGYRRKGKTENGSQALVLDAIALDEAGVDAIVIETVVASVARRMTEAVTCPTIGIGSGTNTDTDGQVRVIHDITGAFPWFVPPFATPYHDIASQTRDAVQQFINSLSPPDTP